MHRAFPFRCAKALQSRVNTTLRAAIKTLSQIKPSYQTDGSRDLWQPGYPAAHPYPECLEVERGTIFGDFNTILDALVPHVLAQLFASLGHVIDGIHMGSDYRRVRGSFRGAQHIFLTHDNGASLKMYCAHIAALSSHAYLAAQAATPRTEIIKDWAQDSYTATVADIEASGHHTEAPVTVALSGPWRERLTGIASEWSSQYPGYLAGAIEAANRAVQKLLLLTDPASLEP